MVYEHRLSSALLCARTSKINHIIDRSTILAVIKFVIPSSGIERVVGSNHLEKV
jgi:hypothetical protein